jgi:hypothetical protein
MVKNALKGFRSCNPRRTAARWLLKKSFKLAYGRGSVMLSAAAAGAGVSLWEPSYKNFQIPCARAGIAAGLSVLLPVLHLLFRLRDALGLVKKGRR